MIRMLALWSVVGGLCVYARRDWFVSLCGLILLMAVIEHPDAPKTMFGIQGLNFWNILLVVVCWYWYQERQREGLTWDMPKPAAWSLAAYLAVICVSFSRMIVDQRNLVDTSTASLVSEYLINSLKWVVPALLLFDGVRDQRRFYLATASILGVYVLLGLYVIKWMPLGLLTDGDELQRRALKILVNEIGYHRVTMSMMLAGASWAVFSARLLVSPGWQRFGLFAAAAAIVLGQALTGGRMGYVTWAIVGCGLLSIRGRAYLTILPVVALVVYFLLPSVADRMLEGITSSGDYALRNARATGDFEQLHTLDLDTVTAGRTLIWPYVEAKIAEGPVFGYGMLAMNRTGITRFLSTTLGEEFAHPHNAYFEALLDNGIVGFALIVPFYVLVLTWSLSLYADARSPVFLAAGGMAASLVVALLVASFGSQSFYPREGTVGMWCAIGLMMRVYVERRRALALPLATTSSARRPMPPSQSVAAAAASRVRARTKLRATSVRARGRLVWPGARGTVAATVTDAADEAPVVETLTVTSPLTSDLDSRLWSKSA